MNLPSVTVNPLNRSPKAKRGAEMSNAILRVLAANPAGLSVTEIGHAIKPGMKADNISRSLRRTQEWLTTHRSPLRIRINHAGIGTTKRVTLEPAAKAGPAWIEDNP